MSKRCYIIRTLREYGMGSLLFLFVSCSSAQQSLDVYRAGEFKSAPALVVASEPYLIWHFGRPEEVISSILDVFDADVLSAYEGKVPTKLDDMERLYLKEALEDLLLNRSAPNTADIHQLLGRSVTTVSKEYLQSIFSSAHPFSPEKRALQWQEFSRKYGSDSLIHLSRVGFNRLKNRAVYYYYISNQFAGVGMYVYLRKNVCKWVIICAADYGAS